MSNQYILISSDLHSFSNFPKQSYNFSSNRVCILNLKFPNNLVSEREMII